MNEAKVPVNFEMLIRSQIHENHYQLPECPTKEDYLSAAFMAMGVDPDKLVSFMQSDVDAALKDILFRCISFDENKAREQGIYNTKPWISFFKKIAAT